MKEFQKWKAQSLSNKVFDIVNLIIVWIIFIACIYPLYYIVIISISKEIVGTYVFPTGFTIEGYKKILQNSEVWLGYANTIFYTVVSVLCSLAVTLPCAYALSRRDFVGRGFFTAVIMVTMFISGGLVPGYLNMHNLGLLNSRWAIILGSLTSAYNIIVSRSFFSNTIPYELLEAARIDGCGNGRFFAQIVLPLSKPITAVMVLYFGVGRWNSYFTEMIYLRDKTKYPLSLVLRRLLWEVKDLQNMIDEGLVENVSNALDSINMATTMQFCLIVVSTLPMMIVYPFLQKYFAQGAMIGSVKG